MSTWYRVQDAARDPQALLDPASWISTTWEPALVTCPACRGGGRAYSPGGEHEDGEPCGRCDGDGQIPDPPRRGVSACAAIDELARYMDEHWGDVRGTVVIELAGGLSDDDDFDEAAGAVLVLPSAILSVTPVADVPEMAGVLARDEAAR